MNDAFGVSFPEELILNLGNNVELKANIMYVTGKLNSLVKKIVRFNEADEKF
jgi:hypothetical protein